MSPDEADAIVEGLVAILTPERAALAAASIAEALDMRTDALETWLAAMERDPGLSAEAAEIRRQYAG